MSGERLNIKSSRSTERENVDVEEAGRGGGGSCQTNVMLDTAKRLPGERR